jgi:hypothetical protein
MAALRVVHMALSSSNPAPFTKGMNWLVTVEAQHQLSEAIEISFAWVADVTDASKDVVLDELEVGPFPIGTHTIELECDAPSLDDLDLDRVLDETCISVSFKFREQEFAHVGWPVRVRWADPKHEVDMPEEVVAELLLREVINKRHNNATELDWGTGLAAEAEVSDDQADDDNDEEDDDEHETAAATVGKRPRSADPGDAEAIVSQGVRDQPPAFIP